MSWAGNHLTAEIADYYVVKYLWIVVLSKMLLNN